MDNRELLRRLPAVHELVRTSEALYPGLPVPLLTTAAREVLDLWRQELLTGERTPPSLEQLARETGQRVGARLAPSLKRVVNATGVILHTNLGRAPLSREAIQAVAATSGGYCNLELGLESGERDSRYRHVEGLLRELTGAEAALVVNNNAAAVLLCLQALAAGREVVVSRGELVEIGGSFRIPEVMAQSGAILKEVGSTNKTYPEDYERAIGQQTALLLKVHPSNYRIMGFTRSVTREELVALGSRYRIPVLEDLGSGVLVDLEEYLPEPEPTVSSCIRSGIDLVTFSGDKLLGGPQAGIIVGRSDLIGVIKKSPLLRAVRVDKLVLAALEATLRAYQRQRERELPVLRMLTLRSEELQEVAGEICTRLSGLLGDRCRVMIRDGVSQVGGGALPLTGLPTRLVTLEPAGMPSSRLAERLRLGMPPVIVRLQDDQVLIDPRTLLPGDLELLVQAVDRALSDGA